MHAIITKVSDKISAVKGHAHRYPRIAMMVGGMVALLIIGSVSWRLTHHAKPQKVSTNPVVANYQKQLPALADAVKKSGNDPQARYNYAVALYATGDVAKAKDQYEAEAKLSQNDPTLENNLGNVYRDLGNYQKAVDAYQKSVRLDPKAVNAYINLANLYLYTLNQKDLAVKTYQDALRNLPGNQDLQVLLGIAYEQSGDKDNARSTYQQVLGQNANNAAAQAGLKRVQ